MKFAHYALLAAVGLSIFSCQKNDQNEQVVSQRYVHKYGYALSRAEWESNDYPGQSITHMRNGAVVTATYEDGVLHGPMTQTFPHSQTVELYRLYNQGVNVKEISYNVSGMPVNERIQLSPTRYSVTKWYQEGTPMSIEDFVGQELLDGQYFTVNNDLDSRVEKGHGLRIRRNADGSLLSKEIYEEGFAIRKESYYPNGAPESIAYYYRGKLNGERKSFAQTGEPIAIEEYVNDKLHGQSIHFNKGNKYLETTYLYGQKNGLEKHFLDGEILSEETYYENDLAHGPATFYIDGAPHQEWYYAGERISKRKFDELNRLDEMISQISPEVRNVSK